MLKKIFVLLFPLGLGISTMAQTKGTTEFGVSAGINASTVLVEDSYDSPHYHTGFNVGLSADHYFSDRWSIKVKLLYDQKGWNDGYIDFGDVSYVTDYKLNYLTIPVMANWHFGHTRNWYLNFGPYVGILLNATETATHSDLNSYTRSPDVGAALGIGVKFPISNRSKLFIEFQGQGGGVDLFRDNTGSTVTNSVSAFNIGINF